MKKITQQSSQSHKGMLFPRSLKGFFMVISLLLTISSTAIAAKHKIGILVYDGVLSSDITAPIEVFGAATKKAWFSSYEVLLITPEPKEFITSEEGLRIIADTSINTISDLDVLIVPSTYDMSPLIDNKELVRFIAKQSQNVRWIASNCSGAYLLAEAGILNNKAATTWAGGESDFQTAYPSVIVKNNTNYVIDGNILTSNGSVVSYQAALVLLGKLSSQSFANEIAEALQWQRLKSAFIQS